jgi:hypothetical protein
MDALDAYYGYSTNILSITLRMLEDEQEGLDDEDNNNDDD